MAITNYLVHFKTEATYESNKDQLRDDAVAFVKDATIIHTHGSDYYCGSEPVALKSDLSEYATTSALTSGLAGKANVSHTHTIAQVSGLQEELNSKLESVSLADLGITATAAELNQLDGKSLSNYALKTDIPSLSGGAAATSGQYVSGVTVSGHKVTVTKAALPTTTLSSLGITATAAEINKLDGITATTQELNYVDGVTSNIQTQLNGKAASSHNHSAANITSGTLDLARIPSITDAKITSVSASKITGTIPQANLPSYVDDVLEYSSKSSFPQTGEAGKIYVDTTTNLTYRWGGSSYVEISPSLALGETSSTAFRGDRGKIAYDHSQATGNPHNLTLSNLGISATAAEINKLDGLTASTAELNFVDGVTSNIQTQLNSKANTSALSSYALKDGSNASGTWPIGISGNAASATNATYAQRANYLYGEYTGFGGTQPPSYFNGMGLKVNMMNKPVSYCDVIVVNGYNGIGSDVPYINALAFKKSSDVHGDVWHARGDYGGSSWGTWYKFLDEYNYAGVLDSHYVKKSGDTMTGALTISTSGCPLYIQGGSSAESYLRVRLGGTDKSAFGYKSSLGTFLYSYTYGGYLSLTDSGLARIYKGSSLVGTLLHSGNYTSYTVTKTGGGASGTWNINISGAAASANSVAWNNVSGKPSTFTPAAHTHSQYLTSSSLSGYATQSWVNSQGFIKSAIDTKNTTGTSNSNNKLYLAGGTSQSSTGVVTYSNSSVYTQNGQLYASQMNATNGFFETSDARLKNFDKDIKALEVVSEIPTKYFTWKSDESKTEHIGTSAQEIQKLYPDLVAENEDGVLSVDYARLSIIALAAIKELKAQIDELKSKIN